jgi:hypothetical protein
MKGGRKKGKKERRREHVNGGNEGEKAQISTSRKKGTTGWKAGRGEREACVYKQNPTS